MAEIYRAKTFDSDGHMHLVAVKRVLAHLAEDNDFIQMLVDEAKVAGMLKHPNVARVYEFARAHGEYFISMEHVDGKDLRTILERCRQKKLAMSPEHAAHVAAEIAAGLHYAHSATDPTGKHLRIVHRDVSPSNVIVSYAGEVKLCDFGIAKTTVSKVNTKTGVIKGKVKYMSPEQALGRRLDHRSDVFSLGSCLYEMLTRVPPFLASNEMDLLIKVRDAKYRPISQLVPSTPPELEAICDRCMTRSRAHRYQTAEEVAHTLRSFLQRHKPKYTRSHLGRYVRKKFAQEIERELRMLEEYVLEDHIHGDVGENLIANVLGPKAEYTQFTPRPTRGGGTGAHFDDGNDPRDSIHEADTLILDLARAQRPSRRKPAAPADVATHTAAPTSARKPVVLPTEPDDDFDEALHAAPTLILDTKGRRRN